MECIGDQELLAFVDGQLDAARMEAIDAHLGACASCARLVAATLDEAATTPALQPIVVDDGEDVGGPLEGRKIGRYLLLQPLGAGGMGIVYKAYDPELSRQIALKLLRPTSVRADAGARLVREAQAMARLSHPNVVAVYDAGTYKSRVFIAMELIEGGTLASWRATKKRSWREVVDVFLRAGQGLAAAHAAGLVHRDFKPENVLIGDDGRVRVTDFGLARVAEEAGSTAPAEAGLQRQILEKDLPISQLYSPLTRTGTLVGSPAYMAPEQIHGGAADARSDIFAFSIALHEMLAGERPFAGSTLNEIRDEISAGRIRELPRSVPSFVKRALLRGLKARPEERWSSMDEMLRALAADPARDRARLAVGALVLALAVGFGLYLRARARAPALVCKGAEAQLAGIWDDARKQPLQAPELAGFVKALDRYSADWIAMRTQACEATRLRGEQSEALLDLRVGCLDRRLQDLSALVDAVSQAAPASRGRASQAAAQLPSLAGCANAAALQSVGPLPPDPALRAKAQALRQRAAELMARRQLGNNTESPAAREVTAAARVLDYPPLLAEALYVQGSVEEAAVDKHARETFGQAAATAIAARDDATAARSFVKLMRMDSYDGKQDEAHLWDGLAAASIKRLGGDEDQDASRLAELAQVFDREGKFAEAVAIHRSRVEQAQRRDGPVEGARTANALHLLSQALWSLGSLDEAVAAERKSLGILQRVQGERHPNTIRAHMGLGIIESIRGQLAPAEAEFRLALAGCEAVFGKDHPDTADAASNLAQNLELQGRIADALPLARRSLDIWRDRLGDGHRRTGGGYLVLGRLVRADGKAADAVPLLEKAFVIYQATRNNPLELAEAKVALAQALWSSGGDRKRARSLATEARVAYAEQAAKNPAKMNDEELAKVDRALAEMR